ncbi:MAG TPA: hypothetical protein GX691_01330 [Clostridia bacterium]|jgi:ClpP class serine protease|nr:hypothetical protein [Clostridia bacterium]
MDVFGLFWLLLIFAGLAPVWKQRQLEGHRNRLLKQIQSRRKSRVITLIHRQEIISLLGLPISRHIDVDDSEHILRAIRLTPDDVPIDLILHSPGGLVLAAEQIARALKKHPAKVTVFVPHYAMSGGTMIALAADQIVMDENAVLGPVDPQLGNYPAVSILRAVAQKNPDRVDDQTLILADIASKAMEQVRNFVISLLENKMEEDMAEEVADLLTQGRWTHDFPITYDIISRFGFNVTTDMPGSIYELMELYPQPSQRRPSVHFIPLPEGGKKTS